MKKIIFWVLVMCFTPITLQAGQAVEYQWNGQNLVGYLSVPKDLPGKQPVPAVLICHAWRGIQDHERNVADTLAKAGVVAFALDIYGKGQQPESVEAAGKLSGSYKQNRPLLRDRANAGLNYLASLKSVNASKIVVIGYCFGGTTALELARSGANLAGVVSFHGGLDSPTPKDDASIKGPVLVLHGAADPYVPREKINEMRSSFDAAHVTWTMAEFSGAVHAFTDPAAGSDPTKGAAYNERADKESWQMFADYFKRWTGKKI